MTATNAPCTIFLHLPKTGGKTLSATLRYKYSPDILFLDSTYEPLDRLGEIPLEERRRARMVTGHVHYGVHDYIPRPCQYITLLREPVSRVISMYYFIRGNPKHWLHRDLTAANTSLEQFVRTAADPGVDNEQTRLLSGRDPGAMLVREPDGRLRARELGPVDETDLELAKDHLARFLVVGLTERFDESFILLSRALGWRLPMYETHNVSVRPSRPAPPSEEALTLIRERNQFDIELYAFAKERFEEAVVAEGPSFRREVAAFKLLNPIPNRLGPKIPRSLRHPLRSLLPR